MGLTSAMLFLLLAALSVVGGSAVQMTYPACMFACPFIHMPVCGNDLKTYPNECEMRRAACNRRGAIIAVYQGDCKDDKNYCAFACPEIYEPICGSDGAKYSSECHLRLAACKERKAISIVRDSAYAIHNKCGRKETCEIPCLQSDFKAVCGSDQKTYSNECIMRVEACRRRVALIKIYDGPCKAQNTSS